MPLDSRVRVFLALLILLCALTHTGAGQTGGAPDTVAAETTKTARRPIELEDILQTREVAEQQLEPAP